MHLCIHFRSQFSAHNFLNGLARVCLLMQDSVNSVNNGCLHSQKIPVTLAIETLSKSHTRKTLDTSQIY